MSRRFAMGFRLDGMRNPRRYRTNMHKALVPKHDGRSALIERETYSK
jgi:hypothetical protein